MSGRGLASRSFAAVLARQHESLLKFRLVFAIVCVDSAVVGKVLSHQG